MNSRSLSLLVGAAVLFGFYTPDAFSQGSTPAPSKPAPKSTPEAAKVPTQILFKLPKVGMPAVRVTGGTRGGSSDLPAIYVLAPEHEALTTKSQPALFWFQSGPDKADFELTLTEPKKP